jgi:hypothetical protein
LPPETELVATLTHAQKSHDPTRPEIPQGYLDAADFDGTGRPGLLLAAKVPPVKGQPYRTAVWYYPRRLAPG